LPYRRSNPPDVQYDFKGEDDFSNECVGGPLGMDEQGIFFAIVVTGDTEDQCLQHDLHGETIDRTHSVVVDGNPGTLNVFTFRASESGPIMVLNTIHDGYCYQFDFISQTQAVRDAFESIAIEILGSFRFGSGPAPTA
jgi:hypothetical protein